MKVNLELGISFIFATILTVPAQVVTRGKCPALEVKDDFNLNKYLGTWYEQEKYFAFFEMFQRCETGTYSIISNSSMLILNQGILPTPWGDQLISASGKGYLVPTENNSAYFIVKFSTLFSMAPDVEDANYLVLDTDYESYSLVYSCMQKCLFKVEYLWILTRSRNSDPVLLEKLRNKIKDRNLNVDNLKATNQTDCSLIPY